MESLLQKILSQSCNIFPISEEKCGPHIGILDLREAVKIFVFPNILAKLEGIL